MPGIRRSHDSLDDEAGPLSDPSPASSPAVDDGSSKRRRLSPDSEASSGHEDSWMLDPPTQTQAQSQAQSQAQQPRSFNSNDTGSSTTDSFGDRQLPDFKPGQLVRISMRNFLTYTAATYYPGPTLNMIIGPNGTGKSSVVCAICIGLDFAPGLLGRSKELHEFVRHGCDEASIELEIKAHEGRTNKVVRLDFTKDGGKKTFFLNGRPCRAKDVHEVRSSFGIQVDNLCHFLPQDRVVEFSRLTPKDRLRETLRGAASAHMTEAFEQLKDYASDQKTAIKQQEDRRQVLTNLENRQNSQRADVERMRRRNDLQQQIKFLRLARPIARAAESDAMRKNADDRYQALVRELEQLEQQLEPAMRAVNAKESYAKQVKRVRDTRKQLCTNFQRRVDDCARLERENEDRANECETKKEAIGRNERSIKNEIARSEQKISALAEQGTQQPIDFDPAEYNARIRDKVRQQRTVEDQIREMRESGTSGSSDINDRKQQVEDAKRRVEGFRTQSGRQMEVLASRSSDTAKAWKWIQNNRNLLKGEVYGPPVLECRVTEDRYAPMLESLFNVNDMLRIVVTQFEDLELLTDELQRKQGLSELNFVNQKTDLDRYTPPMSAEDTRNLGLDGWALDFLQGPAPVLAAMCDMSKIHSTGVSFQDVSETRFKELERGGLSSLLTSKSFYRITRRREYGPDATSTMIRSISDVARWWTSQPVDPELENRLRQQIVDWETEIQQLEHERGNVKDRLQRLNSELEQLKDETQSIEDDKDTKARHNKTLEAIPGKIRTEEQKIEEQKTKLINERAQYDQARQEKRRITLARAQNCINQATGVENLRNAWVNYVTAAITCVEAESDCAAIKASHAEAQQQLQTKGEEKVVAKAEYETYNNQFRQAGKEWKANLRHNDGLGAYFEQLPEEQKKRTPQQLAADIEAAEASLEMLHEGDPRTIGEFEDRARRIERLSEELSTTEVTVRELGEQIEAIRGPWERELDELVARISEAFAASFEKIDCLGSVEVGKSTDAIGDRRTDNAAADGEGEGERPAAQTKGYDFENWTIEIRVSFRHGEDLSVLDSHRQSGGERAVTTIYYLMALQALSQAPFRVVDEINQGMDPRNERIVHERMVDIACNGGTGEESDEGGSQYFLITPKLLQGLKYDWRMKVHNVVSGEFMPKIEGARGAEAVSFGKLLGKMRAMHSAQEVAAAG